MYWIIRAFVILIVKIFFPTKIIGKQNFINAGSIIVCNHYSGWDIPIAYTAMPYKMFVLGKKELFKFKIIGFMFKKLGALPVDRKNVSPATIKEIIKKLKAGEKLLLYPEGTRKTEKESMSADLKQGTALFALSTGVPIIPMMLDRKPKIFKKNILMIKEPIYLKNLKPNKENIEKASIILKEEMHKLKEEINNYKLTKQKKSK